MLELKNKFPAYCVVCGTFSMVTHYVRPHTYKLDCQHEAGHIAKYKDEKDDKTHFFISERDQKAILQYEANK